MCGESGIYKRGGRQLRVAVRREVGTELDYVFSSPAESYSANRNGGSRGGGGRGGASGGAEGAEEGDYSRASYSGAVEVHEWDESAHGAETGKSGF